MTLLSVDDVVARLDGAKAAGDGYEARCPVHDDSNASLSVRAGDRQAVVLHCHAGCKPRDIVEAIGLTWADVCAPRERAGGDRWEIAARYDYTDAEGTLLYRVVRAIKPDGNKAFWQERPDGRGGWRIGLKDNPRKSYPFAMAAVAPVLYRLPQIAAAQVVYVVEGEKDVATLEALGLCATCNPMGAGKWRKGYAEALRGRDVVVLPDNDEPGRSHALDVARSLQGVAARVRVVELPGIGAKGDVTDWVASGVREPIEALGALVAAAPDWSEAAGGAVVVELEPWRASLRYRNTPSGERLEASAANAALILSNHKEWSGVLGYNALACRMEWTGRPPTVVGLRPGDGQIRDTDQIYVSAWLAGAFGVQWPRQAVLDAIEAAAQDRTFSPVVSYLEGLAWDGTPRVGGWLQRYLEPVAGQDPDVAAQVGTWWLISAVARAMRPGCKADHVLVLEGLQGCGKSTAVSVLGGDWYQEELPDLRDKDAAQSLLGHWIVEIGELDAIRGAAATRVKRFISAVKDTYRPSYGRFSLDRPRGVVFCGTTNETEWQVDSTGGRRFWPVSVGQLDLEALQRDRDQIWAEAVAMYRAGATWYPTTDDDVTALAAEQEARHAADPWEELVASYCRGKDEIRRDDVLQHLINDVSRWDRACTMRLSAVFRRIGWMRKQIMVTGNRMVIYRRRSDWSSRSSGSSNSDGRFCELF